MNPSRPHRRRRHYIDARLQGRLLVWLVVGELLLFAAALFGVGWGMDAAVEASLYRVHQTGDSLPLLLRQLAWTVPIVLAVNLLAVAWAERRWRRRVTAILARLEPLLARIGRGDLRPLSDAPGPVDHPVLAAARDWHDRERARFLAARRIIDVLPEDPATDPEAARKALAELEHVLQDAE